MFKFNLCAASSVPPSCAEQCRQESFIGQWTLAGKCEAQFNSMSETSTYSNGHGAAAYIGYHTGMGWSAIVNITCGTTPLASRGIVEVNDQLHFDIPLASMYACPQPPQCKVGPFDLSPIPSKAFPVKVVEANGSSTLHVVQLSLCAPTSEPPSNTMNCGVAAYYGEWSSKGACKLQFDEVPSRTEFNGTHAILYFLKNYTIEELGEGGAHWEFNYTDASFRFVTNKILSSTVYLGCGTTDLDVNGVTRNSRGDLFTTATSKYACTGT